MPEGSTSTDANLQRNDVIIAVDTFKIESISDLQQVLLNYRAGNTAKLTFIRDGHISVVDVELNAGREGV